MILESRIKKVEISVGECIARPQDHRGISPLALQRNICSIKLQNLAKSTKRGKLLIFPTFTLYL